MKKEKVRTSTGEVKGYKIGDWYLIKQYNYFGSGYSWYISKEDHGQIMSCVIGRLLDNKEIEFVESMKDGTRIIEERSL